jgi:hypothetical protein
MNLTVHLKSLEEQLLAPSSRKDSTQLTALLTDDFQEFGSSGRIFSKSAIIAELSDESPRQLSLDNFQVFLLSADIVLVTYISTRIANGETTRFLRSSIWVHKDGAWKIRFHQGTRQADSAGMMK